MTSSFLPTISIRSSPPRASGPEIAGRQHHVSPKRAATIVDVDRDKVIKQGVA